jgi:acetolactate synthase-1/2/3 large subunit
VIVDIDPAELSKPTIKPDLAICADAGEFIAALNINPAMEWPEWVRWGRERKDKYSVVKRQYNNLSTNPYIFANKFTNYLQPGATVVVGNGTACVALFQSAKVKEGQRFIWNSGTASMGYDLPAAIGASIALGNAEVYCITGDGSLQMNIQELNTIRYYGLPIKIFVLCNNGYHSIWQTQKNFFEGRKVGCDKKSGISFPDIKKLGDAYGFSRYRWCRDDIKWLMRIRGPFICEVDLEKYEFEPKLSSEKLPDGRIISKPLEDMSPLLSREEYESNMIREGK